MQRAAIQIVQMRLSDLRPGDIVNKNPNEPRGWFEVRELQPLPNNAIAVIAVHEKDSMNSAPHDLVGVQIRKTFTMPDQSTPDGVAAAPQSPSPESAEAQPDAA